MSEAAKRDGALGFLDSVMGLFRGKQEAPAEPAAASNGPEQLGAELEAAIHELNQKIDARRAAAARAEAERGEGSLGASEQDRAHARERRLEQAHRAMREDIEAMHAQLGTGLSGADLDRIAKDLQEFAVLANEGRDSHELLPRVRYAIGEKLRQEAGELAIARLVTLLRSQKISWPDPTHYRPGASPDEIERSRARRLADERVAFLAQDFERAADRVLGVVSGWGSDYPDRGSPLWEETVLEAVAAGIRGRLLEQFVAVVRRDRDQLLAQTETAIGKELEQLRGLLSGGFDSIDQASRAVASSLRVVDEVFPEIAWEHVQQELPQARGETS